MISMGIFDLFFKLKKYIQDKKKKIKSDNRIRLLREYYIEYEKRNKFSNDKHFKKFKSNLEKVFQKEEITEEKYNKIYKKINNFEHICNFCNKKIISPLLNLFYCQYCKTFFCLKHRLPEEHVCKGKPSARHIQPLKVHDGLLEQDLKYKEDES